MEYVSHQLFRDAVSKTSYSQGTNLLAQRFRIEAHHFITSICAYIFHVCIQGNWYSFHNKLDGIERGLSKWEDEGEHGGRTLSSLSPSPSFSVEDVRELHDKFVEGIMYCCLLKRRQQPILTLLYGTFEPILLFAKVSRMYASREQRVWTRMRDEMEDNTKILYTQFVKRAGMFVRVIGQLERKEVGRSGTGGDKGHVYEGSWFGDLLVRLDGSYFDR